MSILRSKMEAGPSPAVLCHAPRRWSELCWRVDVSIMLKQCQAQRWKAPMRGDVQRQQAAPVSSRNE